MIDQSSTVSDNNQSKTMWKSVKCVRGRREAPVGLLERRDSDEEQVVACLCRPKAPLDRLHIFLLLNATVLR